MSGFWNLFTTAVGLLPPGRAKNWLLSRRPDYDIAPGARIYPCLIRHVDAMRVADDTLIGFGTLLWNLRNVEIDKNAYIGHLNWISASPMFLVSTSPGVPREAGHCVLREGAIMLSRHRIDCSGGFTMEEWSHIVGHGVEVLTHSITLADAAQIAAPVRIGDHAFIGSRALLLPGVEIADHVVVAAGSVVPKSLDKSYGFYVGVPAGWKTDIAPESALFHRTTPYLDVRDF